MRSFYNVLYNRKSIGKVRVFEELKVQGRPTEANCFFVELNYKKSNMKSNLRLNASGFSIIDLIPSFANTMLVAVSLKHC